MLGSSSTSTRLFALPQNALEIAFMLTYFHEQGHVYHKDIMGKVFSPAQIKQMRLAALERFRKKRMAQEDNADLFCSSSYFAARSL